MFKSCSMKLKVYVTSICEITGWLQGRIAVIVWPIMVCVDRITDKNWFSAGIRSLSVCKHTQWENSVNTGVA